MGIFDNIKKIIKKEEPAKTKEESYSKKVLESQQRVERRPGDVFRRTEEIYGRRHPQMVPSAKPEPEEPEEEKTLPGERMEQPPKEELRMPSIEERGLERRPELEPRREAIKEPTPRLPEMPPTLPPRIPEQRSPEVPVRKETPEIRRIESLLIDMRELRDQNKRILERLERIEDRLRIY